MLAFVAEDVATAAPVPYPLYRPQAAPLIADDCANTYAELATSLKAYPTWVRGVLGDADQAKNGLYVCVTADPDLGVSTWQQLLTLEMLQQLAPTLGVGGPTTSGQNGQDGRDGVDGQPGADGKPGQNGQNGTDGPAGADGKNGATILLGTGAPANNVGVPGDLYLNTATWEVFTKASTSWVVQGSVKGSDGLAGADGVSPQLLHGPANPTPTLLAQPGAWFLNTTSGELFEYQRLSGWTTLTVLKGDVGAQGVPGSTTQLRFGAGLPAGALGIEGDSYLDTDSYNVYGRTAAAWVFKGNLRGPAGADGVQASRLHTYVGNGQPANSFGDNDDIFLNQADNGLYVKTAGTWSLALQLQGPKGEAGSTGAAGTRWYLVQGLPDASVGVIADVALNTITGALYLRGAAAWADTGASLRGAPGPIGPTGPAGVGSRIYAGASVPGAALGVATDFYIQYNGLLYEKVGATWTSRGQLQFTGSGATGTGSTGSTGGGATSNRVLFYYGDGHADTNTSLPTGLPDGTVYVDQTAGDLYSLVGGTWEFVLHLKGSDGQTGSQGIPGQSITGQPGKDGTSGQNGKDGADGLPGTTLLHRFGLNAPVNTLGVNGETYTDIASTGWDYYQKATGSWTKIGNLKGPKGEPGSRILCLASDPGATDGVLNDTAINTVSGDIWEKTAATVWTKRGNLKGPKGDSGAAGTGSSSTSPYSLPQATNTALGGVKSAGAGLAGNIVVNGDGSMSAPSNGAGVTIETALGSGSDATVPSVGAVEKALAGLSNTYVAKAAGYGLSSNDYTATEKTKLAAAPSGAQLEAVRTTAKLSAVQTSNYILALADAGNVVPFSVAGTVTVPPNSSVAFPVGTILEIMAYAAVVLTVAAGNGVTLVIPAGGANTNGKDGGSVRLFQRAVDVWVLTGGVA